MARSEPRLVRPMIAPPALIIGTADTFGPVLLPEFSSFMMYAVMAAILLVRPQGLLPVKPAH